MSPKIKWTLNLPHIKNLICRAKLFKSSFKTFHRRHTLLNIVETKTSRSFDAAHLFDVFFIKNIMVGHGIWRDLPSIVSSMLFLGETLNYFSLYNKFYFQKKAKRFFIPSNLNIFRHSSVALNTSMHYTIGIYFLCFNK